MPKTFAWLADDPSPQRFDVPWFMKAKRLYGLVPDEVSMVLALGTAKSASSIPFRNDV